MSWESPGGGGDRNLAVKGRVVRKPVWVGQREGCGNWTGVKVPEYKPRLEDHIKMLGNIDCRVLETW